MTDYISRADAICEVLVNDGIDNIVDRINALPSADAEKPCKTCGYYNLECPKDCEYNRPSAEPIEDYSDLPDIPRAYYEKIVGNMAHEINMLKEKLESADMVSVVRCKDCIRNNDGNYCDIAYYINEDGDGFCNCGERGEE